MIDERVVNILNISDSMQIIDSYAKPRLLGFYRILFLINSNSYLSFLFILFTQLLHFLQFASLSIALTQSNGDWIIGVLRGVSNIFLWDGIISNSIIYIVSIVLLYVVLIALIVLIGIIKAKGNDTNTIRFRTSVSIVTVFNALLLNYFIGPIVYVCLLCIHCNENSIHFLLNVQCYSAWSHILVFILSVLCLILYIGYSVIIAIYGNEIGSIADKKSTLRLNCNYELYVLITRLIFFIVFSYLKGLLKQIGYIWVFQCLIFLLILTFIEYCNHSIVYYDRRVTILHLCGWNFCGWLTFILILRELLPIKDITLFIVIGYIIIIPLILKYHKNKEDNIITEVNIFDSKSIKNIEFFTSYVLELIKSYTIEDRCLLNGIIKRNEEWLKANSQELNEKYHQLLDNEFLKKKYQYRSDSIMIISLITAIYEHHLNKSNMKSDIMLIYSYFLINYMNNPVYAMILCSRLKVSKHKDCYLKYGLMEEIKQNEMKKLQRNTNRDSLKYVPLSNVIVYNYLIDEFKLKIFDAACSQIDYFEVIRNKSNITNSNTTNSTANTKNFLKLSREIMALRIDLKKHWKTIVQINPFCDEIYKDYMLYLEIILKDEEYAEEIMKEYTQNKGYMKSEQNQMKMYNSLFNRDVSSVMLIDGYASSKGKILYTTPNTSILYGYFIKEFLNMTIDDLLPTALKSFHSDIMGNAINNSQLYSIYLKEKNALIKMRSGGIVHASLFIKTLPNMSYGLIYIMYIKKISQVDSMLLLLSEDFMITDINDYTVYMPKANSQSNYGVSFDQCGSHIASILPEILLQLEYNTKLSKMDMNELEKDIKGKVFQSNASMTKEHNANVSQVIEMIKQSGRLNNENNEECKEPIDQSNYCISDRNDAMMEYSNLVNHMSMQAINTFSVFYRLNKRSFVIGKKTHVYYRLYITSDLLTQQTEEMMKSDIIRSPNHPTQNVFGSFINITSTPKCVARQRSGTILKGKTYQSVKQIKIKVSVNNIDNEKGLLLNEEGKNEPNGINPNEQSPSEGSPVNIYHPPSSLFLKIKQNIITRKIILPMLYIRLITFVYLLLTIICGMIQFIQREKIFHNIMVFLNENQFFDNTKVIAGSYYLLTTNFQMMKYDFIKPSSCPIPCHELFLKLYTEDTDLLQTINDETMFFIEEFKQILNLKANVTISTIEINSPAVISINYEIMINLIISTANSYLSDIKTNIDSSQKTDDIHANNFLNILWAYFANMKYNGLDVEPKKERMAMSEFEITQIPLMMNTTLLVITIGFIIWEIYAINMLESGFIKKMIFFQDAGFELYLKDLEELKKKLKNETGNDEESKENQIMSQSDMINKDDDEEEREEEDENDDEKTRKTHHDKKNNLKDSGISASKEKDIIQKNKLKDIAKKHKNKDNEKVSNDEQKKPSKKRISKRAQRHKLSKAQQFKNEKVSEMTSYFFKSNIFFFIKLFFFLLITLLYYIIFTSLHSYRKESYLMTDQIMASIETVYKSSYITFLIMKTQTFSYVKFEVEKAKGLISFDNGATSYTIGRVTYKSKEELIKASMIINIPNNYVTVPKMANQILPLLKYSNKNDNDVITLTELYNGNCCKVILANDQFHYDQCTTFWSGILTKGIEQAMVQMGVVFNTALDELKEVNKKDKPFSFLCEPGSSFWSLEYFLDFYLMYAYNISHHAFKNLRTTKHDDIAYIFTGIFNAMIVCVVLIYLIILFFIAVEEKCIRDFYNMIVIWPYQYIASDELFYDQIVQLGKVFYHIQT